MLFNKDLSSILYDNYILLSFYDKFSFVLAIFLAFLIGSHLILFPGISDNI